MACSYIDVIGAEPLHEGECMRPLDVEDGITRLIKDHSLFCCRAAFLGHRGEPLRIIVGVPPLGAGIFIEPERALESGEFPPHSTRLAESFMKRGALNAAARFELSVRPVQVIEKPQRLGGSLGEKCFFVLKRVGPPNIDIP